MAPKEEKTCEKGEKISRKESDKQPNEISEQGN
jgi:hypothetical protein